MRPRLGRRGADERFALALNARAPVGRGIEARSPPPWSTWALAPGSSTRETATLSGGQVARVALADVLSRFDVTLLDEPTNDSTSSASRRRGGGGGAALGRDGHRLRRPGLPRRRTVTSVAEIDEHSHRAALGGGGPPIGKKRDRRRAGRPSRPTPSIRPSRPNWPTGPDGSASGPPRPYGRNGPRDHDKAQRDFGSTGPKNWPRGRGRRNGLCIGLETVEEPWEGWDLRFTIIQAPRAGAVVAVWRRRSSTGTSIWGPLTLGVGSADG